MKEWFSLLIVLLVSLKQTHGVPTYFISAPKHFERYVTNNIIVTFFDVTQPTNVSVLLNGVEKEKLEYQPNGESLVFSLNFDNSVQNGDYTVNVKGIGGLPFDKPITISMVNSKYIIIFQSTSLVYSPGDLVIFRAIILDEKFRPIKDKRILNSEISILDSNNVKRGHFTQVQGQLKKSDIYGENFYNITKGITNDISFRLDKEEKKGTWQIIMNIDDQSETYKFDIDTFDQNYAFLELNATNYMKQSNQKLNLSIDSQYFFGESVKGVVNIDITKTKTCGKVIPKVNRTTFMKTDAMEFEKLSKINIDFQNYPGVIPTCDEVYNLNVALKDKITKQIYTEHMDINLVKQNIKVRVVNKNEKLKIGLKFKAILEFSYIGQDDFDFDNNEAKLNLKIDAISNNKNSLIAVNIAKNKNRQFLDYMIDNTIQNMTIKVIIDEQLILEHTYQLLDPSCAKTVMAINYQDSQRQIYFNDVIQFIITSTAPISKLYYYCITDGKIVKPGSIQNPNPSSPMISFNLKMSNEIMPRSKLFVYYYYPNTQSIAQDYIDIDASNYFQNNIQISIKDQDHLNNLTHIQIKSEPESNILIHAYNVQNLNNLRKDNLLERQIVKQWKNKMAIYDQDEPIANKVNMETNAQSYCKSPYDLGTIIEDESHLDYNSEERIDKNFKQTWIWDKMNMRSSNVLNMTAIPPPMNPIWQFSAISLSENTGIAVSKEPIEMKIKQNLFAHVTNLVNIKRNSEHEFNVLLHNPFPKKTEILIEFKEILKNSPKIDFIYCDKDFYIESLEIKMINCSIYPLEVGQATFYIKAINLEDNSTIDYIEEIIDIQFEGYKQTQVVHKFFEFDQDTDELSVTYNWTYPKDSIDKSQRIFIMGNIEGSQNSWHDKLLKIRIMPNYNFIFTTIECNSRMPRLFAHISILKYMKVAGQLSGDDFNNRLNAIENELNQACFKAPYDGSIVSQTFGGNVSNDGNLKSSTLVTAQYLKSLKDYSKIKEFNKNKVYYTTSWIKKQELFTGEFLERDENFGYRPNIRNYAIYLTAFTYISLESDLNFVEKKSEVMNYLADQYPHLDTSYEKMITCFVFHLSQHSLSEQCFNDFIQYLKPDQDTKYVQDNDGKPDIEATAYGLLIAIKRRNFNIGFEIFKYFKKIQQKEGTIGDPFQTSLIIDAMAELIDQANVYRDTPKEVKIVVDDRTTITLKDNTDITQIIELKSNTKSINMKISGFGAVNIFLATKYNSINKTTTNIVSKIEACKVEINSIKNTIKEIDLPLGLTLNTNDKIDPKYGKTETNVDKTHIRLYSEQKDNICFTIPVTKLGTYKVPDPAPIQIYPSSDSTKFKVYELE